MTKSVDPFEEYLRKKKVEILEKKFRKGSEEEPPPEEEDLDEEILAAEDPEVAARLREEMEEFFDTGNSAGAELFSRMDAEEVEDESVDEIREVLDEVFEEEEESPRSKQSDTFVQYFQEVQKEFDPSDLVSSELEAVEDVPAPEAETEEPWMDQRQPGDPEADFGPNPTHEEPPPAEMIGATIHPETDEETEEGEETPDTTATLAVDLAEILAPPTADATEEQLRQHLDLLCRLVAKLVERAHVPQNEIIEVLIKSGVEF